MKGTHEKHGIHTQLEHSGNGDRFQEIFLLENSFFPPSPLPFVQSTDRENFPWNLVATPRRDDIGENSVQNGTIYSRMCILEGG